MAGSVRQGAVRFGFMRFVRAGVTGYGRIGSGLVCFGRQRKVARGSLGRLRHGRRGWFGAIWLGPVGFFPAG